MGKTTLTTNLWIEAAFRALTVGGPQAIRAEAIARDLKVSKGSFYWHFATVDALKQQMLQRWRQEATERIITMLKGTESPAADKLRMLVEFATNDTDSRYGGIMAEAAIRDWARYDENAAATVKTVDLQRLAFLETLFEQCGTKSAQCRAHSVILYGALIGIGALSHAGLANLKDDLNCLLVTLLDAAAVEHSIGGGNMAVKS
ncbi:MAG: TetR/AcrR family transcriptional regulator [Rhodobacteraceae bacterium]|nr:TetR/AcrR family transcriptional regulator [Paracoccaceae bacterium]